MAGYAKATNPFVSAPFTGLASPSASATSGAGGSSRIEKPRERLPNLIRVLRQPAVNGGPISLSPLNRAPYFSRLTMETTATTIPVIEKQTMPIRSNVVPEKRPRMLKPTHPSARNAVIAKQPPEAIINATDIPTFKLCCMSKLTPIITAIAMTEPTAAVTNSAVRCLVA